MPEPINAFGRYQVLRELGRGGMATVYLARQVDLDRLVALKELRALRDSDPSLAPRFLREARLAGSLSHPNIVTVHDFFAENGVPVIAMEYVRRGSLRPYVGAISLAQVGGVLEGVLAGLAHAEAHGIVHRDLKPENLLVSDEGRVKIVDFGIAKATNDVRLGTFVTSTGVALGTPNYVAPEQAMAGRVGPWTDLYSVGIVTYELFAGRAPFADTPEPMAVLLKQVNEQVPPLTDIRRDVHPAISEWVAWLLAKDPTLRPQKAQDAWLELEARLVGVLGGQWRRGAVLPEADTAPLALPGRTARGPSVGATQAPTVAPAPHSWQGPSAAAPRVTGRRMRWISATRALALVALALAGLVGAQRLRHSPPPSAAPPAAPPASATPKPAVDVTAAPARGAKTGGSTPATATAAPPTRGDLTARAPALRSIAKQYETAAANVAALEAKSSVPARKSLLDALRQASTGYAKAARAAAKSDQAGYATALDAATSARARVEAATQSVTASRPSTSGASPGETAPDGSSATDSQPGSGDSESGPDGGACVGDSVSDDPSDDSCEP